MVNRYIRALIIIIVLGVIVLAGLIWFSFDRDMDAAREEVATGGLVMPAASGPVEYVRSGTGDPVLVVHGAGGGYDQGLILSELFLTEDYQVIAPSRFGFLGTPLPANASFADQADMFANLLDELNVSRVAIIGISAGGPSTLEFALRYPERTSAVVLVSAVVHKEKPMNLQDKIIHYGIFRSDFLFWVIAEYFESGLVSFFGVTPEVQQGMTPDEEEWLSQTFLPSIHPISERQAGMVNDRTNFVHIDYRLEDVTVPTLIIYARDDYTGQCFTQRICRAAYPQCHGDHPGAGRSSGHGTSCDGQVRDRCVPGIQSVILGQYPI